MAGRAVLDPEDLVAVEEAVGKRQGMLRGRGGGLQPVAPENFRDRAAGRGKWWRRPPSVPGSLGAWVEDPYYEKRTATLCFPSVCVCQDECLGVLVSSALPLGAP